VAHHLHGRRPQTPYEATRCGKLGTPLVNTLATQQENPSFENTIRDIKLMPKKKRVRVDPKRPTRRRKRGKEKSIKKSVLGDTMAEPKQQMTVTLTELMVSTLAMTDALSKLLIEKGIITDEEFKKKLSEERATYQAIPNSI
jgi:hypothetical protein